MCCSQASQFQFTVFAPSNDAVAAALNVSVDRLSNILALASLVPATPNVTNAVSQKSVRKTKLQVQCARLLSAAQPTLKIVEWC